MSPEVIIVDAVGRNSERAKLPLDQPYFAQAVNLRRRSFYRIQLTAVHLYKGAACGSGAPDKNRVLRRSLAPVPPARGRTAYTGQPDRSEDGCPVASIIHGLTLLRKTQQLCKGCPEGTKLANSVDPQWDTMALDSQSKPSQMPTPCGHRTVVDITNHDDHGVGAFRGTRGLHEPLAATQLAEAQLLGHLEAMLWLGFHLMTLEVSCHHLFFYTNPDTVLHAFKNASSDLLTSR